MALKELFRAQAEGKAFPNHPVLTDPTVDVGITQVGSQYYGRGNERSAGRPRLTQREAKRHLAAYGGDQAIDWVMDCVRYTADTVASAEFHFEKGAKKVRGRRVPGESVDPDAVLEMLIEQPNKHMDYVELMELLVIDLLMVGNAYWYKFRTNEAGKPLAIYRLAPQHVEVLPEPWGVGGYEYKIKGAGEMTMAPEEVIHFKLANPHSPYYGLGLVQGAGRSGDLELALTDSQASYFENHAMPSLAVQSDRRVPRDVFKKIRAQLRARMQGTQNAGEVLVLEAGLKLAAVAPNAGEAAFGDLSKMSRDRIFAWFRMSPKLLGITDESGGADKTTDFQRIFDNKTARPLMNKIQKKISAELVRPWGLDYVIDYEYQMPVEDQVKLVNSFASIPGVTVDEVRQYMKLGPHPDKSIGELTLNLPGEEGGAGGANDPTRTGFPDRNLTGEGGRPPRPENTKTFPRGGGPLPPGSKARRPSEGRKALDAAESLDQALAALDAIALEQKALERAGHTQVGNQLEFEDRLAGRRVADTDAIIKDLTAELADAARVLERGLLDHVEGKAFKTTDLKKRIRNSEAWTAFSKQVGKALERAIKRGLSAAVIHHRELTPEEEIDYDQIAKEMVHRKDGVRGIVQTLKDSILNHVSDRLEKNATQQDVNAAIQKRIDEWKQGSAETVAMTEVVRGYNEGTLAVAEAAGVTHVHVSDGEDHDQPCKDANGQTWTISHAREHYLEHPRCRRAFVPAVD